MSTTAEVILIAALVLGTVAVLFGLIIVWDRWGKGTRLQRRIDDFFDRVSDLFFR